MKLFAFLLIILLPINWELLVQYSLRKNFSKTFIIKQCALHHCTENKSNSTNICSSDLIHLELLKKCLYVNKSLQDMHVNVYHCVASSSDDMLNNILIKHSNDVYPADIALLVKQYPVLTQLAPGQALSWFTITAKKKLQCLIWDIYPQEIRIYHRVRTGFTEGIVRILNQSSDGLSCTMLLLGKLEDTFINSLRFLGLEENYITNIINALQYQLNFCKLHEGDQFAILVSRMIHHDHSIHSTLLGVRVLTSGKNYYMFSANNGKFYDRDAVRLENNFIPFPIAKPFRISSKFNLNRLNPITGHISPHPGVDFAVPIGTPVFSVGDGEVIISKYSKIAGNYVVIQHNCHYITRYMHLKKLLVKSGQRIKKGDNIGISGNTGRSTGPHLHFEVWYDRHPVNPLTTKILSFEKLLGSERVVYLNQINKVLLQLNFD